MVEKYERVKNSFYPQVYRSFKARGLETDELIEYYIQDLTEDHVNKALELIFEYFLPEDTFQLAVKRPKNDSAIQIMREFFTKTLKENVSLACFVTKTNEMVGLNTLTVKSRGQARNEVCEK